MQRQHTRYGSGPESLPGLGIRVQTITLRTSFRTIPSNALPLGQSYGGYSAQLLAHVPLHAKTEVRNYYGGYPQFQPPLVPTYRNAPPSISFPPAPRAAIPSSRAIMPKSPTPPVQHRLIAAPPPQSPPTFHAISRAPIPRSQRQSMASPPPRSPPIKSSAIPQRSKAQMQNQGKASASPKLPLSRPSPGQKTVTAPPEMAPERSISMSEALSSISDEPILQRPIPQPAMKFTFDNAVITGARDIASHNVYHSTVNAFDEDTLSFIQLSKLPRARRAPYNCAESPIRGPCHENTRVQFLDDLAAWASDPSSPQLAWLTGMTGTGKTSIAFSFAKQLHGSGNLGGSFFCSRQYEECAKISNVLPTIAIFLAQVSPSYAAGLKEVLKIDPDAGYHSITQQFTDLFVTPFQYGAQHGRDASQTKVVIIDALDECENEAAIRNLVSALSRPFAAEVPLKFLLTSEPDPAIRRSFSALKIGAVYSKFLLHEVPRNVVSADIRRYITDTLLEMTEGRSAFDVEDWPPSDQVDVLVRRSDRLFLYAATACRYVGMGHDIRERLRDITSRSFEPMADSDLDTEPIDSLYRGIIRKAFNRCNDKELRRLKAVLSSVVCLREPAPAQVLSELLDNINIQLTLSDLHSVLIVPASSNDPVSVFHASFTSFVHNPLRSREFYMDSAQSHLDLARQCIMLLQDTLHENICNLPGIMPNDEIEREVIDLFLPNSIRYAVVYFTSHLLGRRDTEGIDITRDDIFPFLWEFLDKHTLHWIECLSIFGLVDVALSFFEKAGSMMKEQQQRHFMAECVRFISHCYNSVSQSCLAVYTEVLAWEDGNDNRY